MIFVKLEYFVIYKLIQTGKEEVTPPRPPFCAIGVSEIERVFYIENDSRGKVRISQKK